MTETATTGPSEAELANHPGHDTRGPAVSVRGRALTSAKAMADPMRAARARAMGLMGRSTLPKGVVLVFMARRLVGEVWPVVRP